ncbi:MAG: universal stress protein [Desulfatitalea sp.]|nr:universal stress protein [Desulfatitalea sp.]NNK02384.1 universal stress protein [Desulfatitalea sp.]
MFKKILFATTASPTCDDAAKVAFDLAKKYSACLYVFHVFGIPTRGASQFVMDVRTGEEESNDADYMAWVKEEMKNTYAARMEGMDNVRMDCTVGAPHSEILRKARKEDVDLMIMGAHTRQDDVGAYRYRQIVGSTMQRVARGARCPVLIVSRPCNTCFWYFNHIIFGTDFSKASMAAFQFAYHTAKAIGSKLYLFHAVDLSQAGYGRAAGQEDIERQIDQARQKIESLYVSRMKDFDNFEIEVWEGIPHIEILKFSREKSADLIVMAHHTREVDPEKALLGSTVEQVVLRSACPVISVNRQDKVAGPGTEETAGRQAEAVR